MSLEVGKILPLPPEIAAQIKSSTVIPSLSRVILGLVENSLDAGASRIDVEVDFHKGSCVVEDDGRGILAEDFEMGGGLGKAYYTCKYGADTALHGREGCFLASVAALSLLTIISRHESETSPASLILHHTRPAARLVPSPPHHQLRKSTHGTKVQVQNMFGNMPVRVKQRAKESADTFGPAVKEMESLRRQIVALLLAWSHKISLTLTDISQGKREMLMRTVGDDIPASAGQFSLADLRHLFPALRLDMRWTCSLLSQSGYIRPQEWQSWHETSASSKSVKISAALSTMPAPSRRIQFVSMSVRPLSTDSNGNVLLDEINKLFQASSFGNSEEYDEEKKVQHVNDRRYKHDGLTNKELRGRGKGVDRWPMFYIRIDLRDPSDDPKLQRAGILLKVLAVLKAMVLKFLESHGFRPNERRNKASRSFERPSLTKAISAAPDCFSSWSRIKSSRPFRGVQNVGVNGQTSVKPSVEASISTSADARAGASTVLTNRQADADEDALIEWVDPITAKKLLINKRTGMAVERVSQRPQTAPSVLQKGSFFAHNQLALPETTSERRPSSSSWAHDLLNNWKNPIFAPVETPIPRIQNETNDETLALRSHHSCDAPGHTHGYSAPHQCISKISKTSLQAARVISQVDRKFILIRTLPPHPILILMDQHAADERIRVESLLCDLRTQTPLTLSKPLVFPITSSHEYTLLVQQTKSFVHWGIMYNLSTLSTREAGTITVTALPPTISQRCIVQPSIILNLIRSTIHSADPPSTVTPPKALMDMINSRACRSSIMFNDELTRQECEELVRRLVKTGNPFQCAHGRVSMVPLVNLSKEEVAHSQSDEQGKSFIDALKSWKRPPASEEQGDNAWPVD